MARANRQKQKNCSNKNEYLDIKQFDKNLEILTADFKLFFSVNEN